jgi:Tfp pilus assembly protein PilV
MRAQGRETQRRAFTLIETVVSVTLFAIAIVGPMSLAGRSIKAAREARSELTATYLASEGIEMIHSIRDNNSADDDSSDRNEWLDLNGSNTIHTACNTQCIVDVTEDGNVWNEANVLHETPDADRWRVYQHVSSGLYLQADAPLNSGYVPTIFSRRIILLTISARQEHVRSEVTYTNSVGVVRTITAEDDIYNWFPDLDP